MILFRNYRERLRLLEQENQILANKLKEIEKQLKPLQPAFPQPQIIREDGWDLSYKTLRKRHRKHDIKFDDGL